MGFRGRRATGNPTRFRTDEFALPVAGPQDLALSYVPLPDSVLVFWGGLNQRRGVSWSQDGVTLSLLDAGQPAQAQQVVVAHYAWDPADQTVPLPDWGASGWHYLVTTDTAADYSGDDVADGVTPWKTGTAPFRMDHTVESGTTWLPGVTSWPVDTDIWVRRRIFGAGSYQVSVRIDNDATVFWNGAQVAYEAPPVDVGHAEFTVGPLVGGAENVLAVHGHDYGKENHLDVKVVAG